MSWKPREGQVKAENSLEGEESSQQRDDLAAWPHSSSNTTGKDTKGRKGSKTGTKPHGHGGLRRTIKWKSTFLRIGRQFRVHTSKSRLKWKEERTEGERQEVTDSKISGLLAPDASLSRLIRHSDHLKISPLSHCLDAAVVSFICDFWFYLQFPICW